MKINKINLEKVTLVENLGGVNGYKLYLFKPSLFQPLLFNFEPMRLKRRMRYLLAYLSKDKYLVYYLAYKDEFVGMCGVFPGGRTLDSTKDDIIIGPYYIEPEHRGNKFSEVLINMVLKNYPKNYKCAYDFILKTNTPSIRATLACGFKRYGESKIVWFNGGSLRRHKLVGEGQSDFFVYKFVKNN